MTDYERLKEELLQISTVLERFPDSLKSKVFDLMVRGFLNKEIEPFFPEDEEYADEATSATTNNQSAPIAYKTKGRVKRTATNKKQAPESYSIDRDLNLRGDKEIPSFKTFFNEKKPSSAAEINAVAVYYLQNLMKLNKITLNHVYTCYKEVGKKPADHFKQSFRDAKNKQGYVEFDEKWNLSIPHRGVSFIEHDLPHQKKNIK